MASDWKTVRVFISSTFRDMQAERDHLVRFVFPRLREKLSHRHIHLVDVDLRWGVTSDADSVEACRDIIDECRPRFLCLLGGRYGTVPPGHERSITAEEVHHSMLDKPGDRTHSLFYFRDPKTTRAIPEAIPGTFRERPGSEAEHNLKALREAIVRAGFQPRIYSARWDERLGRLTELDQFGGRVFADLLGSIDAEFGSDAPPPLGEFEQERLAMDTFIDQHATHYTVGSRRDVLDQLHDFVRREDGRPHQLIKGAPGSGKSALLAKFVDELRRTETSPDASEPIIIYHAVGVSARSTSALGMLRRIAYELQKGLRGSEPSDSEIPVDEQGLSQHYRNLSAAEPSGRTVVIVIDGLNQLDRPDDAMLAIGLLQALPDVFRLVVSIVTDDTQPAPAQLARSADELNSLLAGMSVIALEPLAMADREAVVRVFLARYKKRMSREQISMLLGKRESGTPLYLIVALEELRTLGHFEEIDARIREIPDQVQPLFRWIMRRLEDDPGFVDDQGRKVGPKLLSDFGRLLGASRFGLSHQELVVLLSPEDRFGHVAALERLLRPYLMQRGELLDFFHLQLKQAILDLYLETEELHRSAHARLADHFQGKADPSRDGGWNGRARDLNEVIHHLLAAGRVSEALHALTSLAFVVARGRCAQVQSLLSDYQSTLEQT